VNNAMNAHMACMWGQLDCVINGTFTMNEGTVRAWAG